MELAVFAEVDDLLGETFEVYWDNIPPAIEFVLPWMVVPDGDRVADDSLCAPSNIAAIALTDARGLAIGFRAEGVVSVSISDFFGFGGLHRGLLGVSVSPFCIFSSVLGRLNE